MSAHGDIYFFLDGGECSPLLEIGGLIVEIGKGRDITVDSTNRIDITVDKLNRISYN